MQIKSYRDLLIWQKSMLLAKEIYSITETFPSSQKFGLVSQMQRAAVSVCSNIAEGHNRRATKEFLYFLRIAQGSLAELETQVILSEQLGYVTSETMEGVLAQTEMLGKMMSSMSSKLAQKKCLNQLPATSY